MAVDVCEWYPKSLASFVTTDTVKGECFFGLGMLDPGKFVGVAVGVGRALDAAEVLGEGVDEEGVE